LHVSDLACFAVEILPSHFIIEYGGPVVKFFKTFPLPTLTELDNYELLVFIILHA
jgi:hypothetical protein